MCEGARQLRGSGQCQHHMANTGHLGTTTTMTYQRRWSGPTHHEFTSRSAFARGSGDLRSVSLCVRGPYYEYNGRGYARCSLGMAHRARLVGLLFCRLVFWHMLTTVAIAPASRGEVCSARCVSRCSVAKHRTALRKRAGGEDPPGGAAALPPLQAV